MRLLLVRLAQEEGRVLGEEGRVRLLLVRLAQEEGRVFGEEGRVRLLLVRLDQEGGRILGEEDGNEGGRGERWGREGDMDL